MEKIKKLIGIGTPGGIDDIVIRALKTGVAVFLATPFVAAIQGGSFDPTLAEGAVLAAGAAAVGVLINAVLLALAKFSQS